MLVERKKRGNKKNKLEEIQKPRGYDRGCELSRIVGTTDCTNALMFLVQWDTCDELDLLLASEVNEKSPQAVIAFYEQRCAINAKCEKRRLVQDQYESDLLEHPPADDVIEVLEAEVADNEDEAIAVDESTTAATETHSDVIMANISTVTDTTLNESVSIAGLTETDMSTSDFSARIDEADSTLPPADGNGPPEQLMITPQKENEDDCEVIPEDIEIPNIDDY